MALLERRISGVLRRWAHFAGLVNLYEAFSNPLDDFLPNQARYLDRNRCGNRELFTNDFCRLQQ